MLRTEQLQVFKLTTGVSTSRRCWTDTLGDPLLSSSMDGKTGFEIEQDEVVSLNLILDYDAESLSSQTSISPCRTVGELRDGRRWQLG